MAKAKDWKPNYDHFEKKGFKVGDAVVLIAEVNAMPIGSKGVIADKKIMADGGAHLVEMKTGPRAGQTHYILARDLARDEIDESKKKLAEEVARERKALGWD